MNILLHINEVTVRFLKYFHQTACTVEISILYIFCLY